MGWLSINYYDSVVLLGQKFFATRSQQGRIHGQYQLRTGGQGRKCVFSHFSTRPPWPTDRRTDQRSDQRTDKASYRVACPQLKNIQSSDKLVDFFDEIENWVELGQPDRPSGWSNAELACHRESTVKLTKQKLAYLDASTCYGFHNIECSSAITNPLHTDFCSNVISGIHRGHVTPFWRLCGVFLGVIIVVIAVIFLSIFFINYGFFMIIWKKTKDRKNVI